LGRRDCGFEPRSLDTLPTTSSGSLKWQSTYWQALRLLPSLLVARLRHLVQVRGKHNRRASAEEQRWVQQWLAEARLTVSVYAGED